MVCELTVGAGNFFISTLAFPTVGDFLFEILSGAKSYALKLF
jgi:hypothetical protein